MRNEDGMMASVKEPRRIRRINMVSVLSAVYSRPHISRAEIARATDLAQSTVSQIVRLFIDEGLVVEDAIGKPSGGRRQVGLQIAREARWLLCCSVNKSQTALAMMDLGGDIRSPRSIETWLGAPTETWAWLVGQIGGYLFETGIPRADILGAAFSLQALVSEQEGTILSPISFHWETKVNLHAYLEDALGIPVLIEGDKNAAAFGELRYG